MPRHEVTTRRVLYEIPGMQSIQPRRAEFRRRERRAVADGDLRGDRADRRSFSHRRHRRGVSGSPASSRSLGCKFMEMEWTISMARLIAASGMTAVTHSNRDPEPDAMRVDRSPCCERAQGRYLGDVGPRSRCVVGGDEGRVCRADQPDHEGFLSPIRRSSSSDRERTRRLASMQRSMRLPLGRSRKTGRLRS